MSQQRKNKPAPVAPSSVQAVAFVSLGCPKNLVDSEKMLGLLAEDGMAITPDHASADAIVINTCGFLEASKEESLEVIREALANKHAAAKKGRSLRVIVAGCLVQRHRDKLLQDVPDIDALVGVFDRAHIVEAVRGSAATSVNNATEDMGAFHAVSRYMHKPTREEIGQGYVESDRARLRLTPRHYAYLRISEGCNQGCTFCTIPSIRGRMRSKPLPDILHEARELMADGAFELNLIGQDTTSYGHDIGYTPGLSGLLKALDRQVGQSGGGWVRLMYAYPSCFTDEMIETLAACRNVVKYIDIPLQHINDQILHAMRRKVTRQQTERLLRKLRDTIPEITIRTTLISGFPGETKAQHQELLAFVKDFTFDCLGVFEYSPEPGTPAGRLHAENPVPARVAAARKEEIMLAQQEIVRHKNQSLVGQKMTVLIDEILPGKKSSTAQLLARHQGQAPDIDGRTILSLPTSNLSPGDVLEVAIESANYYDLHAQPVINAASAAPRRQSSRPRKLGLPVLGSSTQSVETRSKKGR